MSRRFEIINHTRNAHTCVECGDRIRKGSSAIALVNEEVVNEQIYKTINYYCNVECYNSWEVNLCYESS